MEISFKLIEAFGLPQSRGGSWERLVSAGRCQSALDTARESMNILSQMLTDWGISTGSDIACPAR